MEMTPIFWIMMSGPATCAAFLKKRSGMSLLLTPLLIIALMYIGALIGKLLPAVYAALALGTGLWLAAIFYVLIKKDLRGFVQRLCTPCNAVFTAVFVFCAVSMRGMQVHTWDEFSHWAYSVQEMLTSNRLYTSALSDDLFKHYPPAMPLWQYFCQVTAGVFFQTDGVNGALLYGTSQVLAFSLFTPFLNKLTWKKPGWMLLALACTVSLPVIVYTDFFCLVYIDAFLGLLAGAVFAMIALKKWKKPLGAWTLALMEFVLVMTKESGLFFAAVSLVYLAFSLSMEKDRKGIPALLWAAAAVLLGKISWSLHLQAQQVASAGSAMDWQNLWQLISGREPDSYRHQVIKNFLGFIVGEYLRFTPLRVPVTYFLSFILLLAGSAAALHRGKARGMLLAVEGVSVLAYLAGLLMLYLYHFGEYGGLELVSAARYIKTMVLCLVMVMGACTLDRLGKNKVKLPVCILLAVLLLLPSWGAVFQHAAGKDAQSTAQAAQRYEQAGALIAEKTQDGGGEKKNVYVIFQEDDDLVYYGVRYYARPYASVNWLRWHLGDEAYNAAYNVWVLSLEAWAKTLYESYDYVYIDSTDAYFEQTYAPLFADEIRPQSVYAVEKAADGAVLLKLR